MRLVPVANRLRYFFFRNWFEFFQDIDHFSHSLSFEHSFIVSLLATTIIPFRIHPKLQQLKLQERGPHPSLKHWHSPSITGHHLHLQLLRILFTFYDTFSRLLLQGLLLGHHFCLLLDQVASLAGARLAEGRVAPGVEADAAVGLVGGEYEVTPS